MDDAAQISIRLSVASLAVGVLAALFEIYQYIRSRRIMRVSCRFSVSTIDFRPDFGGAARRKLSVSYDGQRVERLTVVEAIVRNAGTLPVTPRAVEEPLSFTFPENVELLDSETTGHSARVHVKLTRLAPRTVQGRFRSLDSGEYFSVQFLLTGDPPYIPSVTARILGLPQGVDARRLDYSGPRVSWSALGAAIVLLSVLTSVLVPSVASTLADYKLAALKQEQNSLEAELVAVSQQEQSLIEKLVVRKEADK